MMLKPYKEEKPLITINKIRSILNELGIFVIEKYKQNGDYFTCRVQSANDNLIVVESAAAVRAMSLSARLTAPLRSAARSRPGSGRALRACCGSGLRARRRA